MVGSKNLDELRGKIEDWSVRIRKEEMLDLPEKVYVKRPVELTMDQVRMLDQLRDDAETTIGGHFISEDHAMTAIINGQRILCGHVRDEDGEVVDVPTNRVKVLMEVIEESDEDVIIWTQFRKDVDSIKDALIDVYGKESVAEFHGGNVESRDDDANRFKNDGKCRFMISTQGAGAYGNTWVNASMVIYFSNSTKLEHRLQSEDRCHRIGQENRVTYIDLVAQGTPLDSKILTALRGHKRVADVITNDPVRDWI